MKSPKILKNFSAKQAVSDGVNEVSPAITSWRERGTDLQKRREDATASSRKKIRLAEYAGNSGKEDDRNRAGNDPRGQEKRLRLREG